MRLTEFSAFAKISRNSMSTQNPDPRLADYLRFHGPRFEYVLRLLAGLLKPGQRVLDIGMSRLTELIHERFDVAVDALGFGPDDDLDSGRYYHFDLNDCQEIAKWRLDLPGYDVIVFAEVIEHLYTSPALVLKFVGSLLKPGGTLIIQTPNAVSLPRRLAMLFGRNPFEKIREDTTNPGHFREYTQSELRDYSLRAGLDVQLMAGCSYFDYRFAHHGMDPTISNQLIGGIKNAVYPLLPAGLRTGLTCVARKPTDRQAA